MTAEQTTTPDPAHALRSLYPVVDMTEAELRLLVTKLHARSCTAEVRADALSGLLRGMARRVGKNRVAFDDLRRHMIRVGGKIERERDEARAELARVRPVVDAARAWKGYRDEHPDALRYLHPAAVAMYDAVAALDGDAAATPQPAGESVSELTKRLADLLDVAVETEDWSLVEDVQGALHAAHGAVWAVSSAPPVDVTARLLAMATEEAASMCCKGTGECGIDDCLSDNARYTALLDAADVVRALATPTTDSRDGAS